ncbi:MAG: HD domain-containing protein [Candidatus Sericytochromatia bacterium]|nr:HD domain-containing protein [Candidatus Sericytochromatia bacterium]
MDGWGAPPDWLDDCRRMVARYRVHAAHAEKVARLCDRLFTAAAPIHGLDEAERVPLVAAGFLHDLGHFQGADQHHRHSHYAILHDEGLAAWHTPLRVQVAALALNHRKRKRLGLSEFERPQRARLRAGAALLRLADVLDRDHRQLAEVHDVRLDADHRRVTVLLGGVDLAFLQPHLARKGQWAAQWWQLEWEFVCGEASVRVVPEP